MMKSLLAQLLLALLKNKWIDEDVNMKRPSHSHGKGGETDEPSLEDMCQLFHALLRVVPPQVEMVCLIDGISQYEQDAWLDDYHLVMSSFSEIIKNSKLGVRFKLLMTSPTHSRELASLPEEQHVSLRRKRGEHGPGAKRAFRAAFATLEEPARFSYQGETDGYGGGYYPR